MKNIIFHRIPSGEEQIKPLKILSEIETIPFQTKIQFDISQ